MPSRFISSVIDQQGKTDPKKAKADIFNNPKDSRTNLLIEHDKKFIFLFSFSFYINKIINFSYS